MFFRYRCVMKNKIQERFIFSTAVLLFVAAAFILLTATSNNQLLDAPDALLGISSRIVFYMVAGVALALSAFLLLGRNPKPKLLAVAWLSCNFLVYHIATSVYHEPNLFACLGNLVVWMPVQPKILNVVAWLLLGWMLLGSGSLLIWGSTRQQTRSIGTVIVVSAIIGQRASAAGFNVEGLIVSEQYAGGNRVPVACRTNTFRVMVNGCEWFVHIDAPHEFFDYQESSFHDGHVYTVVSREQRWRRESVAGETKAVNSADASILAGPVPARSGNTLTPVLWQAFASACYLDDRERKAGGGRLTLAPSFRENLPFSPPVPANVDRDATEPRLPIQIVFFDDGYVRGTTQGDIRRAPPFEGGFTNAIFRVTAFTNAGEWRIPRQIVLQEYGPEPRATGSEQVRLERKYEVIVTTAGTNVPGAVFDLRLPAAGLTYIADYRFTNEGGTFPNVNYTATNWLTTAEVERLGEFRNWRAASKSYEASSTPKGMRVLLLLALLVSTAVFTLIFIIPRSSQNKNTNK
jgi:hypothetical protein